MPVKGSNRISQEHLQQDVALKMDLFRRNIIFQPWISEVSLLWYFRLKLNFTSIFVDRDSFCFTNSLIIDIFKSLSLDVKTKIWFWRSHLHPGIKSNMLHFQPEHQSLMKLCIKDKLFNPSRVWHSSRFYPCSLQPLNTLGLASVHPTCTRICVKRLLTRWEMVAALLTVSKVLKKHWRIWNCESLCSLPSYKDHSL